MKLQSLKLFLAIGVGGMVGSVLRYSISLLFSGDPGAFPLQTLIVNLIGCFLLSFLLNQDRIKRKISPIFFAALGTGLIGSFTTFSTFTVETILLFDYKPFLAVAYVLISIFGGLLLCFWGFKCAKRKKAHI